MDHRRIGELDVGVVGLGCNQFGTRACSEEASVAVVREALDAGVNYFDIADEYGQNYADPSDSEGWGRSEEILGRALAGHRDDAVIATKFGSRPHADRSKGGSSAAWIRVAVEDSLRRLGTDRIDLYQAHFPDETVPIEETLGALEDLVKAGKVREVGCCNFTASMLEEAADRATASRVHGFVSAQSALNLFQRGALEDVVPKCEQLGMAFVPYYPLASGMLTGKYRRGAVLPTETRLTDGVMVSPSARDRLFSDRTFRRLDALEDYAGQRGHTLLELAIGWLLAQKSVATVIAGAAKPGQVSANAAAAGWTLNSEDAKEVTDLVASVA